MAGASNISGTDVCLDVTSSVPPGASVPPSVHTPTAGTVPTTPSASIAPTNPPSITPITPFASLVSPTTTSIADKETNVPAQRDEIYLGRGHLETSDVDTDSDDDLTAEKKKNNNKQRRDTSRFVDLNNIPDINLIFQLKSLMTLMQSQFVCRHCRKQISKSIIEVESFGLANSMHIRCECGHQSSAYAPLKESSINKVHSLKKGQSYSNKVNASDFDINTKVLLGLQLGGGGRQELNNIVGMLNLANNPMDGHITRIREDIGLKILEVANEVLAENLVIEKSFSPSDLKENKLLAVSNDARWDKRSSGRRYDSTTGCSVMAGNRTKLVLGLEAMSSQCLKCSANQLHSDDVCSKNYEGSAKGMEAVGALALVKRITVPDNRSFIDEFVSDDDSSSRGVLVHSFVDSIARGEMTNETKPRYNSQTLGPGKGQVKPDTGQLPIEHPPMKMLADHGHRNKNYIKPEFALSRKPKSQNFGITGMDCIRKKRRMSWTLKLRTGGTFDEFKIAVTAVLEHHFDNHVYCGDWCKAKSKEGEEKQKHSMRFRCKTENKEMYEHMKKHHDSFMDEESMKQLFHQWDTNCVEGFNKLITKFLPKDRNFGKTIENKVRIHLAMCLLSIGYKRTYKRLFKKFGLTRGEYLKLFLRSEDRERQWRKMYRKRPEVKKARMAAMYQKIKEGREKQIADRERGLSYATGMMGPGGEGNKEPPNKKQKKNPVGGPCRHCGKLGHSRKTHGACGANLKNVDAARKIMAALTVENGKGIRNHKDGNNSDSSVSVNEENDDELDEMERIEELSFNHVSGRNFISYQKNSEQE